MDGDDCDNGDGDGDVDDDDHYCDDNEKEQGWRFPKQITSDDDGDADECDDGREQFEN